MRPLTPEGSPRPFSSSCFELESVAAMDTSHEDGRWSELTLSIDQVVRAGIRWLPALTAFSFLPYLVLQGFPDVVFPDSPLAGVWSVLKWTVLAVVVYGFSALLHEGIHILAMFVFAGAPPSSIRFGFRPKDGVLYVHTDRPMTARAYRTVLLLPAIIQGVLPIAFGTVADTAWIVLYGYVMLVSAIGDLAVFQLIRPLDGEDLVRDHPTGIGCLVQSA